MQISSIKSFNFHNSSEKLKNSLQFSILKNTILQKSNLVES